MNLPFSREQLFAVIADYNAAVLPAQSALTLLALALVVLVIRRAVARARRLIYHLRLDEIEAAYDLFANQRDGVLKVAITP